MDVLGKLCTLEGNDEVIEAGLEPEAYESLIKVLIVSDVQVVYELGNDLSNHFVLLQPSQCVVTRFYWL